MVFDVDLSSRYLVVIHDRSKANVVEGNGAVRAPLPKRPESMWMSSDHLLLSSKVFPYVMLDRFVLLFSNVRFLLTEMDFILSRCGEGGS